MDVEKDDNKAYLLLSTEKIVDAEADSESTKSEESESDFEIEHEKYLKSWRTKRNMAQGF